MPNVDARDAIAILALLVALVGPLVTWLVARGRNTLDLRMAREARAQQRREALYVDLLEYARTLADRVERRHPFMTYAGDPGPPDMPSDESRRHLRSRADAFGSDGVRSRLDDLGDRVYEFDRTAADLDEVKAGRDVGRRSSDLRQELDARRAAVREAIGVLTVDCRRELDAPKP
jgi:hypothetical protein